MVLKFNFLNKFNLKIPKKKEIKLNREQESFTRISSIPIKVSVIFRQPSIIENVKKKHTGFKDK